MRLLALAFALALTAEPAAAAQDGWTFYADLDGLKVDAIKGHLDYQILTLTHPSGLRKTLEVGFRIEEVWRSGSRLALRSGGHWESFVIVDIATSTIVDKLMVSSASVSPTGRYLAFRPVIPRWARASDIILVYDLTLSKAHNRMPDRLRPKDQAISEEWDVGWAVYPEENVAQQTYERTFYSDYWPGDEDQRPPAEIIDAMHHLRSPLTWISDTEVAFVDNSSGVYRLVVGDVLGGVLRPRIRIAPIEISELPKEYLLAAIEPISTAAGATLLRVELTSYGENPRSVVVDVRIP